MYICFRNLFSESHSYFVSNQLINTVIAVISTEADGYEDSTQDPLIKEDPDLNEKLHHSTNSSINDLIPGISNFTDSVQENKTSHTGTREKKN